MRAEIFRKRPRHHQPLGMRVHDVFASRRRLRIGHEIHVDPRVHLQTGAMRALDHQLERIERDGLLREQRRPRLVTAVVVRVASSAHLHDERVESAVLRHVDGGDDARRQTRGCRAEPRARGLRAIGASTVPADSRSTTDTSRRRIEQRLAEALGQRAENVTTNCLRRGPGGAVRAAAARCLRRSPRVPNRAPS